MPHFCMTPSFTAALKRSIALLATPRDTPRHICLTTTAIHTCAHAKAKNFGFSQQRTAPCILVHDEIPDDPDDLDPADSESDEGNFEYTASVAGRLLGEQHVPRFDIEIIRKAETFRSSLCRQQRFRMHWSRRRQYFTHIHRLQNSHETRNQSTRQNEQRIGFSKDCSSQRNTQTVIQLQGIF